MLRDDNGGSHGDDDGSNKDEEGAKGESIAGDRVEETGWEQIETLANELDSRGVSRFEAGSNDWGGDTRSAWNDEPACERKEGTAREITKTVAGNH
jgi:hypothetical protein